MRSKTSRRLGRRGGAVEKGGEAEEREEEREKEDEEIRNRTHGVDTEAVDATVDPEDDGVAVDGLRIVSSEFEGEEERRRTSKRTSRTSSFSHLRSGCSGQK
jgi:hypothetical protein